MSKRNHEVRVGMSVYWVTTEPTEDGEVDWRCTSKALSGTAPDVPGALIMAQRALRTSEWL